MQKDFIINFSEVPERLEVENLCNLDNRSLYCRFDAGNDYLDGVFKRVVESNKLVVIFPAALPISERDSKRFPALFRWSWVEDINANVWCFEEAIARKYDLLAGWFQERDHFHADVIADMIKNIANSLNIKFSDVTLLGSSLGGFGALMVAPAVRGCLAISDIGQTDLFAYQFQSHIKALCEKIYQTQDVVAVNQEYRDRFSVVERFKKLGHVPNMIVLHELTDEPNGSQQVYSFLAEMGDIRMHSNRSFNLRAVIRCSGEGHRPLYKNSLLRLLVNENRVEVG